MSGFLGVEFVFGLSSLVISVLQAGYGVRRAATKLALRDVQQDVKSYGVVGLLVRLLVPEASNVVKRIRMHLIDHELREANILKKSFTEGFAMVGITGAIIAQIAFTGLSLKDINNTHWTVYAAFILSLIAGCFSVYFSCTLQLALSGLHGSQEIFNWLTRPAHNEYQAMRIPSLYAAVLLVLPAHLLTLSLCSFLIGLGIYLGFLYTERPGDASGHGSALAVLIFYIVSTAIFLSMYGVPWGMKQFETLLTPTRTDKPELMRGHVVLTTDQSINTCLEPEQHGGSGGMKSQYEVHTDGQTTAEEFAKQSSPIPATATLMAIIRNQEEQLGLHRALLIALSNQNQ